MGYEKQTWANGDVITADKLNHMEDGIANAVGAMFVTETNENDTSTLGNTYKEIKDAIDAGHVAYISSTVSGVNEYAIIYSISSGNGSYQIATQGHTWETDNENGYPSYYYGD